VQPPTDDRTTDNLDASDSKDRRIRYDETFKLDAIRLWKSSRRSAKEVARELGISAATLYAWGRESKPVANGTAAAQYMREVEEEITSLRDENARLKLQCETLKKTLSILVEFPESGVAKQKSAALKRR
jgi:transposase